MLSRRQRPSKAVAKASFHLGRPLVTGPLPQVWWFVLLRAATAAVFGVLTLAWPKHTAFVLVGLFGAYALFDGLIALITSARGEGLLTRWPLTLAGLTSVSAGLFALARPRLMALTLIAVLGVWLMVRGVTEIAAYASPRAGPSEATRTRPRWGVLVNGVMSALFGLGLMIAPRAGALGLMWAVGAWAVAHGVLMAPFALGLRRAASPPR